MLLLPLELVLDQIKKFCQGVWQVHGAVKAESTVGLALQLLHILIINFCCWILKRLISMSPNKMTSSQNLEFISTQRDVRYYKLVLKISISNKVLNWAEVLESKIWYKHSYQVPVLTVPFWRQFSLLNMHV